MNTAQHTAQHTAKYAVKRGVFAPLLSSRWRAVRVVAAALVAMVSLGGCYVPILFDVEIELTRNGYYNIIFDGYLAETNLYEGLRTGKFDQAEELKRIEIVKTDLTRSSSTKEFASMGQGRFKLHWVRNGDMLKSKMVSFLRRNENIVSLSYVKESGTISLIGKSISQVNRKRLADSGLGMQGQIRLKTDAPILSHNATRTHKVDGSRDVWLIWDIKNIFDPSPSAVFSFR